MWVSECVHVCQIVWACAWQIMRLCVCPCACTWTCARSRSFLSVIWCMRACTGLHVGGLCCLHLTLCGGMWNQECLCVYEGVWVRSVVLKSVLKRGFCYHSQASKENRRNGEEPSTRCRLKHWGGAGCQLETSLLKPQCSSVSAILSLLENLNLHHPHFPPIVL